MNHSKSGPFENQSKIDHSKSGHVRFQIPTVRHNSKKICDSFYLGNTGRVKFRLFNECRCDGFYTSSLRFILNMPVVCRFECVFRSRNCSELRNSSCLSLRLDQIRPPHRFPFFVAQKMHRHVNIVVFGHGDILYGALILEAVKAVQGSAWITHFPS